MTSPPTAIDYYATEHRLEIAWSPRHVGQYPTKLIRASCGCANCVDERTGVRILDPDSVPEHIDIERMEPVGNYAIKIVWSDGHDTGIYSWSHLLKICPCPECRFD